MNPHSYFFLLGGKDLEMLEIAKMLDAANTPYLDRGLGWGARLSDYQDVLEDPRYSGKTLVGIELTGDIPAPSNYLRIDHHNDLVGRPAAISQVAELLGLELSRWQQLVAANDSGFIPGMVKIGASMSEITEVRAADRKAQGLTEADEHLAQDSIDRHSREQDGVTLVFSLAPLFTPIVDRMYGKTDRLLCFTDQKLTYYWEGAGELGRRFAAEIEAQIAYQGGGEQGYFGIGEGKADGLIEEWIGKILAVIREINLGENQ